MVVNIKKTDYVTAFSNLELKDVKSWNPTYLFVSAEEGI